MTLPPLPLIDDCLFVDNSMLELLTTCPRALQYNKLNQRILAGDKPALSFGSAIHLALEFRYQVFQNRSPDMIYSEEVATILSDYFTSHPPGDDWRNLNWALELMKRYNNKYSVEEFSLLRYDQPIKCGHCDGSGENYSKLTKILENRLKDFSETSSPLKADTVISKALCLWCNGTGKLSTMVELPFAIPLYDYTFSNDEKSMMLGRGNLPPSTVKVIYCGRIDLPVIISNHLFVIDHKTSSMLGQEFFNEQRMSAQQRGYAWAWNKLFPQNPPFGYIINAIRSKEPPIWVQEGKISNRGRAQTVETWFDESLQREKYFLKQGDLVEWEQNTIALIDEFFWHYSRGYFPMKTKWCAKFGKCAYYDVCTLPVEDRDATLASGFFTKNLWSPLHEPSASKQ